MWRWAVRLRSRLRPAAGRDPLLMALSHPTGRRVTTIALIFFAIAAVSQSFAYFQERIQEGARAYVRGQGIWAKAQVDAVFFLQRYARTGQEQDYARFLEMVSILLADREARLGLGEPFADRAHIRDAFLRGRNHPDDIDAMIWFSRYLNRSTRMQEANSTWAMADDAVAVLVNLGNSLRQNQVNGADPAQTAYWVGRVDAVDAQLRELESRFSLQIRETARWSADRLWRGSLIALVLLLSLGFIISRNIFQKIAIYERQLRQVATRDSLTGLPNRLLFDDRLQQATKECYRRGTQFGLLFLDLDGFKVINDRFGHEVGDKLLQHVAATLLSHVREADTVTRRGGDEFTILLVDVEGRSHMEYIRDRIVCSVNTLHEIGGHRIQVGVSVGMSLFPDDGNDPDMLLRHADEAMYRMKGRIERGAVLD